MINIKKALSKGLGKTLKFLETVDILDRDVAFKLEFKITKSESGDKK
jgi:hypothetical protein